MNGGLSVHIPRVLQFALFYNETLKIIVVPDRALRDFYRRSRFKRKGNGAFVKPSSPPPPPPPYTPAQLNTNTSIHQ